jgi:SAM-dependent methyltransferase
MGISLPIAKLLLAEHRRRRFFGSLLALGVQDLTFTAGDLRAAARLTGVDLARIPDRAPRKSDFAEKAYLSDAAFYAALGFNESVSLDFSDFEGADVLFDMNRPDTPAELCDRFDTVLDCGTLEHVFHFPNALGNCFRALKPGGRVVHFLPAANWLDHGFYSFSPTVLADFYAANGWDVNTIQVCRYDIRSSSPTCVSYTYSAGALDHVGAGGLDDGCYAVFCVATRAPEATGHVIPQQGYYRRTWPGGSGGADRPAVPDPSPPPTAPRIGWARRLASLTRIVPPLNRALQKAYGTVVARISGPTVRRKGIRLPEHARY